MRPIAEMLHLYTRCPRRVARGPGNSRHRRIRVQKGGGRGQLFRANIECGVVRLEIDGVRPRARPGTRAQRPVQNKPPGRQYVVLLSPYLKYNATIDYKQYNAGAAVTVQYICRQQREERVTERATRSIVEPTLTLQSLTRRLDAMCALGE
ncbi:hypothetical protein J6590_011490 [Homalodisca vitripennis]|nr:hypothetical protein J6590_011490 [Homalodisca vitripennis]